MLRLGRRCRHSCQMRRWSGHDAGRDSRKRLANFLRIRLLSSWQRGKSLHIARAPLPKLRRPHITALAIAGPVGATPGSLTPVGAEATPCLLSGTGDVRQP
jgi:hypothetical protein